MTTEYNKIHTLAGARKKVMDKFGNNLLSYWPLADPGQVYRDLARRKPLFGKDQPVNQQPGVVDYAVQFDGLSDFLCDAVCDHKLGDTNFSQEDSEQYYAFEIQRAGAYKDVQVKLRGSDVQRTITAYIVPAETEPNDLDNACIAKGETNETISSAAAALYTVIFPGSWALVPEGGAAYWLVIKLSAAENFQMSYNTVAEDGQTVHHFYWTGSAWAAGPGGGNQDGVLRGVDMTATWDHDDFSIGCWVDSPLFVDTPKMILTIANASGSRMSLWIEMGDSTRRYTTPATTPTLRAIWGPRIRA